MNTKYSYSRLSTYVQCPRKHYYNYIEKLETRDSPNTIPGTLFHKCCELWLNHEEGFEEKIEECFTEFDSLCNRGILKQEAGLLRYIFEKYLQYYDKEFEKESTLLVEYKFSEPLNDEDPIDYFNGIIDEVYKYKDLLIVRDRKTSLGKLKYTYDKVKYNQQLLLYTPFVEDKLGLRVDAIEIDEVRFARLQQVPILKSGKPTRDRGALELVTYEYYFEKLKELCIETEPEYRNILEYLQKRGHPLFNRIKVQLLDESIIGSNAQDILDMYRCIKNNYDNKYRNRNALCDYCEFKELCSIDMCNPDDDIRNSIIEKLKSV